MRKLWERLFVRPRSLEEVLDPKKIVKIEGILFQIRKLTPMDYLQGFKSVAQVHDVYKRDPKAAMLEVKPEEIKTHYAHVLVSAVIQPKLSLKKPDPENPDDKGKLWVESLFNSWDICEELYSEILEFTYGKKKLRSLGYQRNASSNSTS